MKQYMFIFPTPFLVEYPDDMSEEEIQEDIFEQALDSLAMFSNYVPWDEELEVV